MKLFHRFSISRFTIIAGMRYFTGERERERESKVNITNTIKHRYLLYVYDYCMTCLSR